MHRFRSSKALFRLKLGSLFFILLFVSLALLIPAVIWGTVLNHSDDLLYAEIALGAAVVCGLGYLMVGSGVRCPLCHGPLIGKPNCSRNRKAARMLGSHRLAVASRVLTIGCFRCPCCGEPCKCDVRS
ncbi:hypothetical protein [Haloferula sp.]|uniref:hypothetical protein n=1 Tax=Haloferula sp. TaxID=2497595 RepID=UPI00329D3C0A